MKNDIPFHELSSLFSLCLCVSRILLRRDLKRRGTEGTQELDPSFGGAEFRADVRSHGCNFDRDFVNKFSSMAIDSCGR
jgi:hypothetical protein